MVYLFSEPQRHVRQPLSSRDPGSTAQVAPRQEAEPRSPQRRPLWVYVHAPWAREPQLLRNFEG